MLEFVLLSSKKKKKKESAIICVPVVHLKNMLGTH